MLNNEEELYESFPSGILIVDSKAAIQYANEQAKIILNISAEPDVERAPFSLQNLPFFKGDDFFEPSTYNRCFQKSDSVALKRHLDIELPDGRKRHVLLAGKRIKSATFGDALLFVVIDLSSYEYCSGDIYPFKEESRSSFFELVGKDPKMLELYRFIELGADSEATIVIEGESGTGKELVARAIHRASKRSKGPFLAVNCSALSESLLESELFGHIKGSFTGAIKDTLGKFESANGGTLFLDEIGEISQTIQVKLLRVLQERVVVRVGDSVEHPIDIRLIAATNKNLRKLVSDTLFREDLFFRLNVFPIHTVPLRDRKIDIPLLCDYFIETFNRKTGKHIAGLSPDAARLLLDYCWPGNVRELENCIEHSFVLCRTLKIEVTDLPKDINNSVFRDVICTPKQSNEKKNLIPLELPLKTVQKRKSFTESEILSLIESCGGNKSEAARRMGISTVALWKKLKKINKF